MDGERPGASVARAGGEGPRRLAGLLDEQIELRALTPGRSWQESTGAGVVERALRCWCEDGDPIDELLDVETGRTGSRFRARYRSVICPGYLPV